jgi:hypothetical protein
MKTTAPLFTIVALLTFLVSSAAHAQLTKKDTRVALDAYRAKTLPASLSPAQKEALQGIVGLFRNNNVVKAKAAWQKFCAGYFTKATAPHAPQIESWVIRESYVETTAGLEELLEKWDEELQSTGDDAQLANVDMQNILQKQQQTMQMMSQISKQLHDTAMAVIRKMGG